MKVKQIVLVSEEERDAFIKVNDMIANICKNLSHCDDCPFYKVCSVIEDNTKHNFTELLADLSNLFIVEG